MKGAYSLIPLVGFLAVWQAAAQLGLANTALFPAPTKIFTAMGALRLELLGHLATTLKRLSLAVAEGIAIGVVIGVLMGLSRRVYRFLDPLITWAMPIPGIAMAPLFIIWLGFGDPTIITVGAIAAFFPVVYNTSTGIRSVDKQLVRAAQLMGTSKLRIMSQVYVPWSAVYLITGARLGLVRCWRTVIAVEFIAAANRGLGYMILDAAEYLNASVVYGGILLLALVFTLLDRGIVRAIERVTVEKWGMVIV